MTGPEIDVSSVLLNHAVIMRSTENPGFYLVCSPDDGQEWRLPNGEPAEMLQFDEQFADSKLTTVVLTVHHIGVDYPTGEPGNPHDKMDCRDENLIALCQRCHLLADLPTHIANAKKTRLRKKAAKIAETGQEALFDV